LSYRNPEITTQLLPKIKKELQDKNFVNTLQLRKKFGCTGKRASIILKKLGWSWFSTSSRYQVYKKDTHKIKE